MSEMLYGRYGAFDKPCLYGGGKNLQFITKSSIKTFDNHHVTCYNSNTYREYI